MDGGKRRGRGGGGGLLKNSDGINILIIILMMLMTMWTAESSEGDLHLLPPSTSRIRIITISTRSTTGRGNWYYHCGMPPPPPATWIDFFSNCLALLLISRSFNQLPSKWLGTDNKFQFYSFDLNAHHSSGRLPPLLPVNHHMRWAVKRRGKVLNRDLWKSFPHLVLNLPLMITWGEIIMVNTCV